MIVIIIVCTRPECDGRATRGVCGALGARGVRGAAAGGAQRDPRRRCARRRGGRAVLRLLGLTAAARRARGEVGRA